MLTESDVSPTTFPSTPTALTTGADPGFSWGGGGGEAQKIMCDHAHHEREPCHNHQPAPSRLKSRKSFLHEVQPLSQPPQTARLTLWEEQRSAKQHLAKLPIPTSEQLAPGHKSEWKLWKSLNRLRTGTGRSKTNMSKWGYICWYSRYSL